MSNQPANIEHAIAPEIARARQRHRLSSVVLPVLAGARWFRLLADVQGPDLNAIGRLLWERRWAEWAKTTR